MPPRVPPLTLTAELVSQPSTVSLPWLIVVGPPSGIGPRQQHAPLPIFVREPLPLIVPA